MNLTFEVKDGILNHKTSGNPLTLEGRLVQLSDKFAYVNHDLSDALRGGIITPSDIPKHCLEILGNSHSERINTLISDIAKNGIFCDKIELSPHIAETFSELRAFLFKNVYADNVAKDEEVKANKVISGLYFHFIAHPEDLPESEKKRLESEAADRIVCDYIAGMSDFYAINEFKRIFIPDAWGII